MVFLPLGFEGSIFSSRSRPKSTLFDIRWAACLPHLAGSLAPPPFARDDGVFGFVSQVVKQRVDEHWGYDFKEQAEDAVCLRREV